MKCFWLKWRHWQFCTHRERAAVDSDNSSHWLMLDGHLVWPLFSSNGRFIQSPEGHSNAFQQIGNLVNSHLAYWISVHATEVVVQRTFIQPAGFSTNFDGILSLSFLVLGAVCWWIVYKPVWWECIQQLLFFNFLIVDSADRTLAWTWRKNELDKSH